MSSTGFSATTFSAIPQVGTLQEQLALARHDRLAGLRRLSRLAHEIVRFSGVFGRVALVYSPALAQEVLVTDAKSYRKSPVLRGALYPLAGHGLFTSEGELWRRQRKLMAPLFTPAVLAPFTSSMTIAATRVAETWPADSVLDVSHEMTNITMAVAGGAFFGTDMLSESSAMARELTTVLEWVGAITGSAGFVVQARVAVLLQRFADRLPTAPRTKLSQLAERAMIPPVFDGAVNAALRRLNARVRQLIAERRATPDTRDDLLALLLRARDADTEAMSDKQVRDEVMTLLVAGHETTASALSFALALLAEHPSWAARAHAEADALSGVPTNADLSKLEVCTRVFKEAMRLYPPIYMLARVAIAETTLAGFHIAKGTVVMVSPYALHRRDSVWPDPERFDPDRFLPATEATRARTAYLPFGFGPRVCLGAGFAMMEGPLILATLLRRFTFEHTRGPVEAEPVATLRPRGGLPMRVRAKSVFVSSA